MALPGNVPFLIHDEFDFPIFVALPLIWKNHIPNSLPKGNNPMFKDYKNGSKELRFRLNWVE